tara:strand:+ start:3767 stop:4408 length:642 start_codon:yes stop_codon:yes gene_type:complete
MINFLLKNPSLYRFYQKIVRAKYDEYDFFRFIFKQNNFKNMRMLDICCGDSYILEYINEFVDDYLGIDSNDKYLKQCQLRWKNFNFINLDLNDKTNIDQLIKFKPNFIFVNGAIHHLDNKTVKSINYFIKNNFSSCYFLSVDPIKHNNALLNKIMIKLDRGKFIRNKSEYTELMDLFESFVVDDFYKMKFENIFHYKNFDLKELYHNWKKEVS